MRFRALYYAIFVVATGELEVYRLVNGHYQQLQPDPHGHYPIETFGVALGAWHGFYLDETAPWLRWYDLQGNLMPLDAERLAEDSRRVEQERSAPTRSIAAPTRSIAVPTRRRLREEQALRAEQQALPREQQPSRRATRSQATRARYRPRPTRGLIDRHHDRWKRPPPSVHEAITAIMGLRDVRLDRSAGRVYDPPDFIEPGDRADPRA